MNNDGPFLYSVGPITHKDAISLFLGSNGVGYYHVQAHFKVYFCFGYFNGNLFFYVELPTAKKMGDEDSRRLCVRALEFIDSYVETCTKDDRAQFIDEYFRGDAWMGKVSEKNKWLKDFSPAAAVEQTGRRSAEPEQLDAWLHTNKEEAAELEIKKEVN
jgi:hypothetical protein